MRAVLCVFVALSLAVVAAASKQIDPIYYYVPSKYDVRDASGLMITGMSGQYDCEFVHGDVECYANKWSRGPLYTVSNATKEDKSFSIAEVRRERSMIADTLDLQATHREALITSGLMLIDTLYHDTAGVRKSEWHDFIRSQQGWSPIDASPTSDALCPLERPYENTTRDDVSAQMESALSSSISKMTRNLALLEQLSDRLLQLMATHAATPHLKGTSIGR